MNRFFKTFLLWPLLALRPLQAVAVVAQRAYGPKHQIAKQASDAVHHAGASDASMSAHHHDRMMDEQEPFSAIGMGGTFTVLKMRDSFVPDQYHGSGWYLHSKSTVAYEWVSAMPTAPTAPTSSANPIWQGVEFDVRKPPRHKH